MGIIRSDRHDLIANYDNSGMKLLEIRMWKQQQECQREHKRNVTTTGLLTACVSAWRRQRSRRQPKLEQCAQRKPSGWSHVSAVGKAILGIQ